MKKDHAYILRQLASYRTIRTDLSEIEWIMLKLSCTEAQAIDRIAKARAWEASQPKRATTAPALALALATLLALGACTHPGAQPALADRSCSPCTPAEANNAPPAGPGSSPLGDLLGIAAGATLLAAPTYAPAPALQCTSHAISGSIYTTCR